MRGRWLLGIILGLALLWQPAQAAEEAVQVRVILDRVQITVGDLLTYELHVQAPSAVTLELPAQPTASFGEWEVHACEALPVTTVEGATDQGWRCSLTIWKTGYHALPTQIVKYTSATTTNGRVTTEPLSVEVASVLDENPTDIKPLKPQMIMETQLNYLLILGLSLLALLLVGFIMWGIMLYRKRPQPVPVEVGPPPIDPVTAALTELTRIEQLQLVSAGRVVDHYTLIADTLRRFIADRFSIPALERTTGEVRRAMTIPQLMQRRDILLALLAEADGVKFAQRTPDAVAAGALLEHARQAILATR